MGFKKAAAKIIIAYYEHRTKEGERGCLGIFLNEVPNGIHGHEFMVHNYDKIGNSVGEKIDHRTVQRDLERALLEFIKSTEIENYEIEFFEGEKLVVNGDDTFLFKKTSEHIVGHKIYMTIYEKLGIIEKREE